MAISLTKPQAAYRAWVMAAQGLDEETSGLYLAFVEELVDEAVKAMCDKVAMSDQYTRLQVSYTVTAAGDGSAILNDADIPETVKPSKGGRVTSASFTQPLIYLNSFRDLFLPKQGQGTFGFYTLRGGNSSGGVIYCANADGTPLTGSLTILACQYQTFSSLAPQFEDDFLTTLAELAKSRRQP